MGSLPDKRRFTLNRFMYNISYNIQQIQFYRFTDYIEFLSSTQNVKIICIVTNIHMYVCVCVLKDMTAIGVC